MLLFGALLIIFAFANASSTQDQNNSIGDENEVKLRSDKKLPKDSFEEY